MIAVEKLHQPEVLAVENFVNRDVPRQATGIMESHTSPSRDQRDIKDNGAQGVVRQLRFELHAHS